MEFPDDIVGVLRSYSPYSFHITNKKLYYEYLNKSNASIIKLQAWYRQNMISDLESISKRRLVQFYSGFYEWEYLKEYPLYLSIKCGLSREIKNDAYVAQLSNDKRKIINFLSDSRITKEHILYAGW